MLSQLITVIMAYPLTERLASRFVFRMSEVYDRHPILDTENRLKDFGNSKFYEKNNEPHETEDND